MGKIADLTVDRETIIDTLHMEGKPQTFIAKEAGCSQSAVSKHGGDSWCTDSLWSSPKCLYRLCLTVFSSLRSSLLLVHIFLPNVFLPINFTFNILWYSTPWTATPFSNDPLGLTLFVEGVNDRLLDHCQVSSVPHYCGFKEQEIPTIYTVWMVIYWNSNVNILIFWDTDFWLSLAVSSNHQN